MKSPIAPITTIVQKDLGFSKHQLKRRFDTDTFHSHSIVVVLSLLLGFSDV
jgi:hypothetical protein